MKITKSVLSILAIAISSSAFASTPTENNYAKITADAFARATHSLRGESGSTDSKNERTLILIKSNSNAAYTYKVYSEQESKTVQDLSDKLSNIGFSDGVIYTTIQAQLDESRKESVDESQFSNTVNIARRGLLGSLYFAPSEIQKFKEADSSLRAQYAAASKNIIENNLNFNLDQTLAPVDSDVNIGIVKFANEYKEKENARAISEFNALQEIALKEPDLAVKSLIKQAADLKLASYNK
ncbi:hypothetical protein PSE10A_46330 [Pseudomonas amygdali pv. eriobotryae]|uniref:Uncharacterized protein n=1 Tax=Pseudomonas amygdali pv. eriobotryae TaxID=129137 RepID=A0A9P3EEZ0_PSEA0|nr:hypothetical protein [Pseudomonas amygdali]GFZ62122.1 hypothetical protein PSE10A_46330 [Pseudomonas amygdali pv. eriobotryae]